MTVVDDLRSLSTGDEVSVVVEGTEYRGEVIDSYHDQAEIERGVPVSGTLSIDIELDNETVSDHGLDSHSLSVIVTERRPDSWSDPEVTIWEPVLEDGYVTRDEYTDLGELEEVETNGGESGE